MVKQCLLLSFPPKMQGLEQRVDAERQWAAGWPPSSRQSSPEGQDEGGVSACLGLSPCLACCLWAWSSSGVPAALLDFQLPADATPPPQDSVPFASVSPVEGCQPVY